MSNAVHSIKNGNSEEAKMESYRCNSCSIEFNLVEELIDHTQEAHTSSDGGVTCGRCQLNFADLNDFIAHYRSVHDESCLITTHQETVVLDDDLKDTQDEIHLEGSNQGSETSHINSDEAVNQDVTRITIINDDGEAIGLAENGDDESLDVITAPVTSNPHISALNSSSVATSSRKRRAPLKYRDPLYESAPKRPTSPVSTPLEHQSRQKEELEIDVSNVSSIRLLRTNNTNDQQNEVISYLRKVEEKLDCIIKHFNVPFLSQLAPSETKASPVNNLLNRTSFTPKRSSLQKQLLSDAFEGSSGSVTMRVPMRSTPNTNQRVSNTMRQSQETVTYISCDAPPQEITQYVISDDLLEATYMKSRNRGNFAKNLVYAAFPLEERLGRNCYGRRGGSLSGPKDPLEQAKLDAVREAVFKKFPVLDGDDEEAVWKRECVIAIDTALRSEMRTRILNMQMPSKHELKHSLMNMPM